MFFDTIDQARVSLRKIIQINNQYRPRMSLDLMTPEMAHQHHGTLKKNTGKTITNKLFTMNRHQTH